MEKVFIPGGTGYIGSFAVSAAKEAGVIPVVLTRSIENADALRKENIEVVVGSLYEDGEWQTVAKDADYAIFLASPPTWGKKVTKKVALEFQEGHLKMTKRFLDACTQGAMKKIVYIAGTSYYGDSGNGLPKKEGENEEPKGWGPYIAQSVDIIPEYVKKDGMPIVLAFPGQVYGPGSWMPQLFLNAINDAKPVTGLKGYNPMFSPIHAKDCGRAIIHLLTHGEAGEHYFLVDNQPVPLNAFRDYIGEAMKKSVKTREVPRWLCQLLLGPVLTEYATAHTNFSNQKLKDTGFNYEFLTYREGVPEVVEAWLSRTNQGVHQ